MTKTDWDKVKKEMKEMEERFYKVFKEKVLNQIQPLEVFYDFDYEYHAHKKIWGEDIRRFAKWVKAYELYVYEGNSKKASTLLNELEGKTYPAKYYIEINLKEVNNGKN